MNEIEGKSSNNKIIKGLILFLLYLVVLYVLFRYITSNTDVLNRLATAPRELIVFGIITTVLSTILPSFLDVTCSKVYGIELPKIDAVVFTFISTAINLVLPFQMGSVVKAVYYKKKMKMTYSRYLSIVSGTIIINIMVTFIILILSLLVTMLKWNIGKRYVIVVSIIFLLGLVAIIVTMKSQTWILKVVPFQTYTKPVLIGFFEIFNNKRAMFFCTVNFLASMLLGGLRFVAIFLCLGISTGFVNGMLYFGLYCASSIVPVLPGNVGISEAIMGVMNMIIASNFDAGVAVVLVNRVYYYIIAIIGAVLFAVPAWIMYKKPSDTGDING